MKRKDIIYEAFEIKLAPVEDVISTYWYTYIYTLVTWYK